MASDPQPPSIPLDAADGWELTDDSVETLFELASARIRGATRRYEDEGSRSCLRDATDGAVDCSVQFVAGTRLGFDPPLPPGVTPTMFLSILRPEARKAFADRLRERGLEDVERAGSQRIRIGRRRARLQRFRATNVLDDDLSLSLLCWVTVWVQDGATLIATGGHPAAPLAAQFGLDTEAAALTRSADDYRDAFLSTVREME